MPARHQRSRLGLLTAYWITLPRQLSWRTSKRAWRSWNGPQGFPKQRNEARRTAVKPIVRRLQVLDRKVANHELGGPGWVETPRASRRRGARANGVPYVEPP